MGNLCRLIAAILLALLLVFSAQIAAGDTQRQPNIILVYVDDMGVGDVGYTGGQTRPTPHIDRMAAAGKVFTQYYSSAPVCSPSRVAITTGMYPVRWNINTFLSSRRFNRKVEQSDYLDPAAPSLARSLQQAGYRTAHFGKWHMGGGRDVRDAPSITEYGFDEYATTWEGPDPDPKLTSGDWIWKPGDEVERWERTAYFVDKTLDFLARNKDRPSYINLWPDDIHSPWVASADAVQEDRKEFYTLPNLQPVIDEFDRQMGRLMRGLEELGIEHDTLVIFTSDNGPAPGFDRLRTNGLRGVKNSLYEGGILMPFIAHWPGTIEAGQVDSASLLAAVDLYPTLAAIAGAPLPSGLALDGQDASAALTGPAPFRRGGVLFWEYGRNEHFRYPEPDQRSPQLAAREGRWKVLTDPERGRLELYDLSTDPAETANLADLNTGLAEKLATAAIEWYRAHDREFAGLVSNGRVRLLDGQ